MAQKSVFIFKHLICATIVCGMVFWLFVQRLKEGADILPRQRQLEQAQPDVVLIGNSVLRAGIDEDALGQLLGQRVLKATSNGSASAWWYLYAKNVLCASPRKPKVAIIFFRDHFLTAPQFRTDGRYRRYLRMLSASDESVLARKAYGVSTPMSHVWSWAPEEAKERFERRLMKTAATLCRSDKHSTEAAVGVVFGEDKFLTDALTLQQLATENDAGDANFISSLPGSLLPDMLSVLTDAGIQPVFVRCKRRRDVVAKAEPASIINYIAALSEYLREREIPFIDTTELSVLNIDHYGPGDHLNAEGKRIMTEYVAGRLRDYHFMNPQV